VTESSTAGRLVRRRLRFERDFTQIPNAWLRDDRLGFRAIGVLGMLMSHEAGYEISLKSIAGRSKDGISAIRTAVEELEAYGYLRREQMRASNGRLSHTNWELCDPSEAVDNAPLATFAQPPAFDVQTGEIYEKARSKPSCDFPTSENPTSENPTTENRTTKEEQLKNTPTNSQGLATEALSAASQTSYAAPATCPRSNRGHLWLPSGYCANCGRRDDEIAAGLLTGDPR